MRLGPSKLLAVALALVYLAGYLWGMTRIQWLGLFSPRGGIVGLALYLVMALGLLFSSHDGFATPRARFKRALAGWLLLLMPPFWCIVSLASI